MALKPPAAPWSHGSSLLMLGITQTCNFMGQITYFVFSSKFHFLLAPEYGGPCLCRGLLYGSDAPSHPLQPGASELPCGRAKPPAAVRCLSGQVVHGKHTVLPPATNRFSLARAALLQHTAHGHSIPPHPRASGAGPSFT